MASSNPQFAVRRGVFETVYGNAAVVLSPRAKQAFDLDMAELIPLSMVDFSKYLRPVYKEDCGHEYD